MKADGILLDIPVIDGLDALALRDLHEEVQAKRSLLEAAQAAFLTALRDECPHPAELVIRSCFDFDGMMLGCQGCGLREKGEERSDFVVLPWPEGSCWSRDDFLSVLVELRRLEPHERDMLAPSRQALFDEQHLGYN